MMPDIGLDEDDYLLTAVNVTGNPRVFYISTSHTCEDRRGNALAAGTARGDDGTIKCA